MVIAANIVASTPTPTTFAALVRPTTASIPTTAKKQSPVTCADLIGWETASATTKTTIRNAVRDVF